MLKHKARYTVEIVLKIQIKFHFKEKQTCRHLEWIYMLSLSVSFISKASKVNLTPENINKERMIEENQKMEKEETALTTVRYA